MLVLITLVPCLSIRFTFILNIVFDILNLIPLFTVFS